MRRLSFQIKPFYSRKIPMNSTFFAVGPVIPQLSLGVKKGDGLSPSEQRKIIEVVEENIELFMEEWNEFASKKK